jgi:hypothetical protein
MRLIARHFATRSPASLFATAKSSMGLVGFGHGNEGLSQIPAG